MKRRDLEPELEAVLRESGAGLTTLQIERMLSARPLFFRRAVPFGLVHRILRSWCMTGKARAMLGDTVVTKREPDFAVVKFCLT